MIYVNSIDHQLYLDLSVINESRENDDLSLIKNDSLRKIIYHLVSFNEIVVERERTTNGDLNTFFVPYLTKNYNLRNSSGFDLGMSESKLDQKSIHKVLNDQEFENLIVLRILYLKDIAWAYSNLNEMLLKLESILNAQ